MELIFIDIDNTLLDFDECVKQAMKSGLEIYKLKEYEESMFDIFTQTNNKLWNLIENGEITLDELSKIRWNAVFDKLGIDFDGVEFEKYFRNFLFESTIPIAGADELLKYLSEKYVLCAASNGPYAQQLHRLELANMKDYFTHIFVSEKLGASKPSTVFFQKAFDVLNANSDKSFTPDNALIIGDSLSSDIAGGIQYKMKTCFFARGRTLSENTNADYIVNSLVEIKNIL